jgi:hypothetical protein
MWDSPVFFGRVDIGGKAKAEGTKLVTTMEMTPRLNNHSPARIPG